MGIEMKMKYLPRTTEFSYLEEELQYVRSGTGHCSAGLPLIRAYCNFGAFVLYFWQFCLFCPLPVLVLVP
jgi:hypothetical protein